MTTMRLQAQTRSRTARGLRIIVTIATGVCALLMACAAGAEAAPEIAGQMDTSFDGDGKLTLTLPFVPSSAPTDPLLFADGSTLTATSQTVGGDDDVRVVRVTPSGTPDSSFGSGDGMVDIDFLGTSDDYASALVMAPDGKVWVVATIYHGVGQSDLGIARLTSSGALDTTFDTDGMLVKLTNNDPESLEDALLTAGGSLMVLDSDLNDNKVWALNPDGTLDTGWATDGTATLSAGGSSDAFFGMLVLNDGSVLVAGCRDCAGSDSDAAIVKLTTLGQPDGTFDTDGVATYAPGAPGERENFTTGIILGDGTSAFTGRSLSGSGLTSDGLIATINPTTGAATGTLSFDVEGGDQFSGIAEDASSRLVVWGNTGNGAEPTITSAVVGRFARSPLTRDASFGTSGIAGASFGSTTGVILALRAQADGKLLSLASSTTGGVNSWHFVRMLENGTQPTPPPPPPASPPPAAAPDLCTNIAGTQTAVPAGMVVNAAGACVSALLGGAANDLLPGTSLADVMNGGGGNDTMRGGAGNDTIRGGAGNDRAEGGAGDDRLFGDAGDDTLRGGPGNDRVTGGRGRDKLFGDAGKDNINGRDGAPGDNLSGGRGADVCLVDRGDTTKGCEKVVTA